MALVNVPVDIEKLKRSQFLTYLDTTPSENSSDFELLGVGITDYGVSFNPQVDNEKWICEDNARSDHKSNQKQSSVSQKCYKNDPVFEFVYNGIDKLNYITKILDIDTWNEVSTDTFKAKLSNGKIAITKYMGEEATIEYDLYYDGDTVEGTVQFVGGKPVFTPGVSL